MENTTFQLQIQIDLPSEYGACEQMKTSPVAILAVYEGSRMSIAAPDWVKIGAKSPVFWQPRSAMMDLIAIAAKDEQNIERRDSILDWVSTVVYAKDHNLP